MAVTGTIVPSRIKSTSITKNAMVIAQWKIPRKAGILTLGTGRLLCTKVWDEGRKLSQIQKTHGRCTCSPWCSKMYCACANAFLNENITQTIMLMKKTSQQSWYLVLHMLPPCMWKRDEINSTFVDIGSIPQHRCCTRNSHCEIATSVWQIEPPVNATSKANCNWIGKGVNGHGSHKLRTKAMMNLLTTLLMVGTHTLNFVTTITLHCACYRRTFNVIGHNVQAKNMPWEWISHYVRDSQCYFLTFFGQNSTARLSKWIIFNEEYYCDAVPTKIEASTSNSHKNMALQLSRPSDPGVRGLASWLLLLCKSSWYSKNFVPSARLWTVICGSYGGHLSDCCSFPPLRANDSLTRYITVSCNCLGLSLPNNPCDQSSSSFSTVIGSNFFSTPTQECTLSFIKLSNVFLTDKNSLSSSSFQSSLLFSRWSWIIIKSEYNVFPGYSDPLACLTSDRNAHSAVLKFNLSKPGSSTSEFMIWKISFNSPLSIRACLQSLYKLTAHPILRSVDSANVLPVNFFCVAEERGALKRSFGTFLLEEVGLFWSLSWEMVYGTSGGVRGFGGVDLAGILSVSLSHSGMARTWLCGSSPSSESSEQLEISTPKSNFAPTLHCVDEIAPLKPTCRPVQKQGIPNHPPVLFTSRFTESHQPKISTLTQNFHSKSTQ